MKHLYTLVLLLIGLSLTAQPCTETPFSNIYWSSYFGGNGDDVIMDVAVDQSSGQMYIIGHTTSTNLSATNTIGTLGAKNTFIGSINPDASIDWITLIGGWEDPHRVAIDPNGELTLIGMTTSTTLPGVGNIPGFDKTANGGQDILILKLSSDGTAIVYSSFYGGNGDETFEVIDKKMEVEFFGDKVFIMGETMSTDLQTSSNAIDATPAEMHISVLDLSTNTLDYCTYLDYREPAFLSYAIAVNDGGQLSTVFSYSSSYSSLILPGAVQSVGDDDNPHPILLRFNNTYDVVYGTYISPHRRIWTPTSCNLNGVANTYPYWDFDLEVDAGDNLYFYQTGGNFRLPQIRRDDIAFARNYFPDLTSFSTNCDNLTGSTIMKLNFCEEPLPFLENIVFGLYGDPGPANANVVAEIEVDDFGRVHYVSAYETSHSLYNIGNDPIIELGGNYIIYDVGLQGSTVQQLYPNVNGYNSDNFHNVLTLYDNKAYMAGGATDIITPSPTWTDENGNTNNTPQALYAGGGSDGIIQVIDNSCVDLPYDCCNLHPEYNILQDFYIAANGPQWTNNSGWEDDCFPCNWFGVTCDANQNVIGLNFWNNNLSGTLPASICDLTELQTLIIRENTVSGPIPSCIGQMKNLSWLQLNNNMFSGPIPDFTGTPDLAFLSLANNELTGSIPGSIGSLPLQTFSVIDNDLSGCFDADLMPLCSNSNIIWQAINPGNNFDAQWDDFCATGAGSCCSHPDLLGLQAFYDESNGDQWTNTINNDRPWFEDCDPCGIIDGTPWKGITCNNIDRISQVSLNNNNLTGVITPDINLLEYLQWFVAFNNDLGGNIPSTFCDLNLFHFRAPGNNFIGTIPSCFDQLPNLTSIVAFDNNFSGPLPEFTSTSIEQIQIHDNGFTGMIPSSYGSLSQLTALNLSANNLTGCYDANLNSLCTNSNLGLTNMEISAGNSFDAPWEDFCLTGVATCMVSTQNELNIKFKVSPNPSKDLFNISFGNLDMYNIEVFDMKGTKVKTDKCQEPSYTLDLSDAISGLYLLKISNESSYQMKKIVKI